MWAKGNLSFPSGEGSTLYNLYDAILLSSDFSPRPIVFFRGELAVCLCSALFVHRLCSLSGCPRVHPDSCRRIIVLSFVPKFWTDDGSSFVSFLEVTCGAGLLSGYSSCFFIFGELDARARKFDMCVRVWTRVFGSLIHASGSWIHVSGSWICVLCYPVVRQIFFRLLSLSDPVFFV